MIKLLHYSPTVPSTVAYRSRCIQRSASLLGKRRIIILFVTSRKDIRRKSNPQDFSVRADLYQVLHVSPTASKAQISASYRRLARKYHPDVNASEEASAQYGVSCTHIGTLASQRH